MHKRPGIALPRVLATLASALVLAGLLAGCSSSSSSSSSASGASASGFDGAALPAAAPAHGFELTDQDRRAVSLSRYRGQVTIIAFLYSTCGATCILIAQQVRGALDELPHPVPVLFIS